jgi:16S rRNA (guanine(966)-N(2))-methyltransferase RsmD
MTGGKHLQGAPQQVRIIGGIWKRTPLPVATAAPGLRPTPDRVRETVFNWLSHLRPDLAALSGLDLFAGTGALGFELASRGARSVTLVESNALALEGLRATQARLDARHVEVVAGEALAVAARLPEAAFDIVFLDPPFDASLQRPALVAARRLLAPDGLIYVEAPSALTAGELEQAGLELVRAGRAGRVAFHLLRLPSA